MGSGSCREKQVVKNNFLTQNELVINISSTNQIQKLQRKPESLIDRRQPDSFDVQEEVASEEQEHAKYFEFQQSPDRKHLMGPEHNNKLFYLFPLLEQIQQADETETPRKPILKVKTQDSLMVALKNSSTVLKVRKVSFKDIDSLEKLDSQFEEISPTFPKLMRCPAVLDVYQV